jgi:transposase
MRGADDKQASMFSVISPDRRIPADHPLRRIKQMADEILAGLSSTFDAMYSSVGRPSIPPERLLKSQVLMALYTVRSDRQFCEQLDYNLLFRWFLDMSADEPTFDASSFSRNRDRLLEHDVAGQFFAAVVEQARAAHLMSHDHFTVDGTLIEAWASLKSFKRKDGKAKDGKSKRREPPDDPGNPTVDFRGEKRSNDTHASTTDDESRLARKKGKESKLSYSAHALMENRNGLIVDFRVEQANGFAERRTAIAMLRHNVVKERRVTVGGDKGYDTYDFARDCREINVTPHIAQTSDVRRRSAIDDRTTRHAGYLVSQRKRKLVEEIFGWMKTVGNFRRTRFKGLRRTQLAATFVAAAYNMLRVCRLLAATA